MAQLVGKNCTRCKNRIGTVEDSRFCGGCGSPVHNDCMTGGTLVDPQICGPCGSQKGQSDHAASHMQNLVYASPPISPSEIRSATASSLALEDSLGRFGYMCFIFFLICALLVNLLWLVRIAQEEE